MAQDTQDDSQKTEEPTQRRLEEARKKGQVAKSQEVTHWFMILAAALLIGVFGASFTKGIASSLYRFVEQPHSIRLDGGLLREVLFETMGELGLAVLAPVVVIVLAALISGFIQNGVVFSVESLKPKLEKLSLAKGLKRLFSSRSIFEFAKGVAKIMIVGAVVVLLMWPEREIMFNVISLGAAQFMEVLQGLATRVLVGVLAIMTVIAGLDFLYQKHKFLKEHRMSKQDLKEEYKQSEGDPMIKARLRQIRTERARRRMMAAVPRPTSWSPTRPTTPSLSSTNTAAWMRPYWLPRESIRLRSASARSRSRTKFRSSKIRRFPARCTIASIWIRRSRQSSTRRSPRS